MSILLVIICLLVFTILTLIYMALFSTKATAINSFLTTSYHAILSTNLNNSTDAKCAVCLCRIKLAEVIKELRCDHVFHKACLDGWSVAGRSASCPLCRAPLARRAAVMAENTNETMLFFEFSSYGKKQENWWLR